MTRMASVGIGFVEDAVVSRRVHDEDGERRDRVRESGGVQTRP